MKRIAALLLTAILLLSLAACGGKGTWQEQYDLGMRYLNEGNYQEAVIAFEAAIKIDPKRPEAYLGRGQAYLAQGEYELAERDFTKALELDSSLDLSQQLNRLDSAKLLESLRSDIAQLSFPFTVDQIVLGESSIDEAKSTYISRPYAQSNLMNDDAFDTVYAVFSSDSMPVPEGYHELEFDFIFSAPASGGGIDYILINDADFLCLGGLRVGDDAKNALAFFGIPYPMPIGNTEWTLADGGTLSYFSDNGTSCTLNIYSDSHTAEVYMCGDMVHRISLEMEE